MTPFAALPAQRSRASDRPSAPPRVRPWRALGLACALLATPALASEHGGGHAAEGAKGAKASNVPQALVKAIEASAPGARAAAPAPTPVAASTTAKAAQSPVDPMDALREKLAQRLSAHGAAAPAAAHTPSPGVVRVVARSGASGVTVHGEESPASTATKPARRPAAGHGGHTAGLVAKLRAEKRAAQAGGAGGAGAHGPWSYGGPGGPEHWGDLRPEFATCASGQRQSPIDIRGGVKVDLEPVQFDYRPSSFSVIDTGHTVQVNVSGGNAIQVMGRRYDLLQFHFHRPSEERIDGRQFDMSVHLVHRDPEGRLAVVGVLLDRGSVHPLVQSVWNNLPLEKGEALQAQVLLDPNHLLPADRRYFTYMGSLTTPPCSEGVLWMVMQQPVPVSPEQVGVFSRMYPMNARPLQSAAGRMIKGSN